MQDGNIHLNVSNHSRRKKGGGERSVVATAAYVSGTRLWDERANKSASFDERMDVVFSRLLAPAHAPDWAKDRQSLWNAVEKDARRKDARLAKVIEAAITRDIPAEQREALLLDYVQPFVDMGLIADVAIHEDGTEHNPHVHILLTTKELAANGFGKKHKTIETKAFLKDARARWAALSNKYLMASGSTVRVDHRSYKARGIFGLEPTRHRGPDARERAAKRELARYERAARLRADKQIEKQETEVMAEPTQNDKELYPLLTERNEWPPSERPSPDMKLAEREELHRYWQDQKIQEIENDMLSEPEADLAVVPEQAQVNADWERDDPFGPEPARGDRHEPAKSTRQQLYEIDLAMDEAMRERIRKSEQDVWLRATNMNRTQDENELLAMVHNAGPDMKQQVTDLIMFRRMEKIRAEDNRQRQRNLERAMEPELRDKVIRFIKDRTLRWEDHVFSDREREADPVPGPDNEPRHPLEMDQAFDNMIREYENEQERER